MRSNRHRFVLRSLLPPALATVLAAPPPAQTACFDFGSAPVAARVDSSPTTLGCPYAPAWPQWHLFVPPHRAPSPHTGFRPGEARELPAVLVTYRCTGFLFLPARIARVRRLGYVIDQPEYPCDGGGS